MMISPGKQTENRCVLSVATATAEQSVSVPFLLFTPHDYMSGQPSPLLLFLHGLGESGDGDYPLLKKHGPPKLAESFDRFPFVTVSPQCPVPAARTDIPSAWQPAVLMALMEHVGARMTIDRQRIYVTGLSMGGFGTWRLVMTYPDKFAAAIPICGGGETEWTDRLKGTPIWAFHGKDDQVVPLHRSKEMVDAVQLVGGDVKLTIYPGVAHDSWTRTYENREIYDWLLRHKLPDER
jgi:predicted peptidase